MNTIITIDEAGKVAVCTIPLNRKLWNLPSEAAHRITIFDRNVGRKSNPLDICASAGIKVEKHDVLNVETYSCYRRELGFALTSYQHEIDLVAELDQAHGLNVNEYSYFNQRGELATESFD